MNREIIISNRKIGLSHNPIVIAEIGINHGGSLEVAKNMAKKAIDSGVDVVKHQTHIVEDEMSSQAKKEKISYIGKSIYELMEDCALSQDEEIELKKFVEDKGCIYMSTPFSRAASNFLNEIDVPAFKIGSGECNNYPLIKHICSFGKPIILSTGMNDIDSVKISVNIMESFNIDYALLHTTNIYPTPHHLVRLGSIKELYDNFPRAVIGLSDHTTDNLACFGGVALGASILERHFTDDMKREGPDIENSMDPKAAKELVEGSKKLALARGGKKGPIEEEKDVINFAYASVVSIRDIKKGEVFDMNNIWVKRPGDGPFFAKDFESILGKKAVRDIKKDQHIQKEDLQ
tara:strand:+ start:25787 stop:26827 length:1041 start_codon:yes stop_codon:yes gene_type:complete